MSIAKVEPWMMDAMEELRRENHGVACMEPGKYHYNSHMRDCPHCRPILKSDAIVVARHYKAYMTKAPETEVKK